VSRNESGGSAAVIAVISVLACTSAPRESALDMNRQPINGVSCSRAVLEASRSYRPTTGVDGEAALGGPMAFVLPATIPVTAGAPGTFRAILSLGMGSRAIECVYRGDGVVDDAEESGDEGEDDAGRGGTAYVFDRCKGRHNEALAPGDAMTADTFRLHLKKL
jgi:hypothetical protein